MIVPYWVKDAIFYQIFPDRFANGDESTKPVNVQPWGSPPTIHGFQGGNLRGIIQHLDYLLDLGINSIYLNPIFLSPSTHRYNTTDYYQIDPRLGDMSDFRALLDAAHKQNIRVILDGVFNHCGRGFFAFNDLLENQEHSGYKDWFHVNKFPIDAYSPGDAQDYIGWWKYKSLPKFNTSNPYVRRYIMNVARYWIQQGADGWRLDVPNEIDDDEFWAEFREVVKSQNPDAYILGEIWDPLPRWVSEGHCDGLMNYPLRDAILGVVNNKLTINAFSERIDDLLKIYARENLFAMYNPLGSHDTERLMTVCINDQQRVKLALLCQFSLPGAPSIYYGDEIGMEGGKDPSCRGAFRWEIKTWNCELRAWIQQLIALRKRIPALRRGEVKRILADNSRFCYAFSRVLGKEQVLVAMNTSDTRRNLRLTLTGLDFHDGQILHNLLGAGEFFVSGDTLAISLPPRSGVWLQ
ncbi:MAG TPA: glycoside hydrolase family 13 protein [Anaerolineaceae bacterium]